MEQGLLLFFNTLALPALTARSFPFRTPAEKKQRVGQPDRYLISPIVTKKDPAAANEVENRLTGVEKQVDPLNENQSKIHIMLITKFLL